MRVFYFFLMIVMSVTGYSQTVTTILDSPTADVDDALAFDSKGNLYGSNFAGDTVYKITKSGQVSAFATGLQNPNGLAFDSHDNLYVVEYSGAAIRKYDSNGTLLQTFSVGPFPSNIIKSFRGDSMIFTHADFGDPTNNSINELLPDGTTRLIYGGAPLNVPVGLAYDRKGNLFIGNYLDRQIYRMKLKKKNNQMIGNLKYIATVPSGPSIPFLAFIAYTRGFLYGTVYGEHKIFKINPRKTDDVSIYAGSTNGNVDGDVSVATFSLPSGIIASKSGRDLFVSEFNGVGNIRKIRRRGNSCHKRLRLKLYPNPTATDLNVKVVLDDDDPFDIKIYNQTGTLVFESTEDPDDDDDRFIKTISVNGWAAGYYNVVVSSGNCKKSKIVIVNTTN